MTGRLFFGNIVMGKFQSFRWRWRVEFHLDRYGRRGSRPSKKAICQKRL